MRYMFALRKSIPTKRAQIVYNAPAMSSAPTRHRSVTKPVCAVLVRCGWCSVALSRFPCPFALPCPCHERGGVVCPCLSRAVCGGECGGVRWVILGSDKNVGKVVMHFFSFLHFY